MYIRDAWREEVQREIDAIEAEMKSGGRKYSWLIKQLEQRGLTYSPAAVSNYMTGKSLPPREFISQCFDILNIKSKRKVG